MALIAGEQIGQYTIQSILGQGGMATVYRAYHARLNRYVAIKVIHPDGDDSFTARFEREAQIVAALDHPNIVPVYDYAEHQGMPYLVMKMIDGVTLRALLADGPLLIKDTLEVLTPLAKALDYAHRQGVLHRDIKPSNVLLDKGSVPYLSDFGLARIAHSSDSSMSAGVVLGTPHYISPEQVLGKPLDHRADLYSFGIVIYEILLGNVPFTAGTPFKILQDHVTSDVPPLAEKNLPPQLEIFLRRALAKDPDMRFDSASAMIAELRRIMAETDPGVTARLDQGRAELSTSLAKNWIVFDSRPVPPSSPNLNAATAVAPAGPVTQSVPPQRLWIWGTVAITAFSITVLAALLYLALRLPSEGTPVPTAPPAGQVNDPNPESQSDRDQPQDDRQPPPDNNAPLANVGQRLNLLRTAQASNLPLATAQAQLAAQPRDMARILAVVRAQFRSNDIDGALTTIETGAQYANDQVEYFITAADLAEANDLYYAAVILYNSAYEAFPPNGPVFQIRSEVSSETFRLHTHLNDISETQLTRLRDRAERAGDVFSIANYAVALVGAGDLAFAQQIIDAAFAEVSPVPELYIARALLKIALNDPAGARADLENISSFRSSPPWVSEFAQQTLNQIDENS